MSNEKNGDATSKAENRDDPASRNASEPKTDRKDAAYPNNANESKGAGSPYGGTNAADAEAPDGNQQINRGASGKNSNEATLPDRLGDEYDSQSSYGDAGDDKAGDDNGEGDARGFVTR